MPERKSYVSGTPNWVDLQTTDPAAAKQFYGELFGWTLRRPPGRRGQRRLLLDGDAQGPRRRRHRTARATRPRPACRRTGTRTSASTTSRRRSARSRPRAAPSIAPPFDVIDAGRMAVIQDPTGAMFELWQAKNNIGASLVNEPGAFSWTELITPDVPEGRGLLRHGVRLGFADARRADAVHRVQARRQQHRGRDEPADARDPAAVGHLLLGGRHRRDRGQGEARSAVR